MPDAQISMQFLQGGKDAYITFDHYSLFDTDAAWDQILLQYSNAWFDRLKAFTSPQCSKVAVKMNQPFRERSLAITTAGTATGNATPISNALLVKKQCAGGPSGRFFLPGLVNSGVDTNGELTTTYINQWNGALPLFLADINSTSVMTSHNMIVKGNTGATRVVTGLTARRLIGTQRRRLTA